MLSLVMTMDVFRDELLLLISSKKTHLRIPQTVKSPNKQLEVYHLEGMGLRNSQAFHTEENQKYNHLFKQR